MTDQLTIAPLGQSDECLLAGLLLANELVTEDLVGDNKQFFTFHTAEGKRVGIGGLELYGEDALIRSIVTLDSFRGAGCGGEIIRLLGDVACRQGACNLYLLTTTAAPFFLKHGFEEVERQDVPESIRGTEEFSRLCPHDAVAMVRRIPQKHMAE